MGPEEGLAEQQGREEALRATPGVPSVPPGVSPAPCLFSLTNIQPLGLSAPPPGKGEEASFRSTVRKW